MSAFGTLRNLPETTKNGVVEAFIGAALADLPTHSRQRKWTIHTEYERPELLGEHGTKQPV
ncbi:hypothetical protein [Silicimonas sp. MF1-12-2]|uniref:hypothetical protein n=1 Tax=Silicimonas sp. MF1-12-2 TaxID=3384793 RepID=UPI0039B373FB